MLALHQHTTNFCLMSLYLLTCSSVLWIPNICVYVLKSYCTNLSKAKILDAFKCYTQGNIKFEMVLNVSIQSNGLNSCHNTRRICYFY